MARLWDAPSPQSMAAPAPREGALAGGSGGGAAGAALCAEQLQGATRDGGGGATEGVAMSIAQLQQLLELKDRVVAVLQRRLADAQAEAAAAAGPPPAEDVGQAVALGRAKVELRDALQQLETAAKRIAALEREVDGKPAHASPACGG